MPKYTYDNLMAQITMLASGTGQARIEQLRVFYPKAGWTELRHALKDLATANPSINYDEQNHVVTLQ